LKILKPIDGYAGEGITLVTNKQEIQTWIRDHKAPGWVIQDYVLDPNLKEGKKFHLRVHVVVIGSKVFMCKEIRYYLAKDNYVRSDWKNKDIHDTHYIEGQNEYLFPQDLPDTWESGSLTGVKHIVKTVFKGIHVKPDWNGRRAYYIFGIDIMFSLKKPFLLEVNDRVGLSERSVETLIPGVLDLLQGTVPETFVKME
jgi:predicted ATP-grasp superfamily ATP-dependent carboligase